MQIGRVLPWSLSLWRRLAGWHGATGAGGVRGGTPGPLLPVSWGRGARGLISCIVISAHVLMGVINGCESIQSSLGLCCIAATPFNGTLPHPWMANLPEGC